MTTPADFRALAVLVDRNTFKSPAQQALLRDILSGHFVYSATCPLPREALLTCLVGIKAPEVVLAHVRGMNFGEQCVRPSKAVVAAALASLNGGEHVDRPPSPLGALQYTVTDETLRDMLEQTADIMVPDGAFTDALVEQRKLEDARGALTAESVRVEVTADVDHQPTV